MMVEEILGNVEKTKGIRDLPEFYGVVKTTYFLHVLHILLLSLISMDKAFIDLPADPFIF